MKVLSFEEAKSEGLTNVVLSVGKFDGLHCGHHQLLTKLVELSDSEAPSVIITFWPHPNEVINKTKDFKRLFSKQDFIKKFAALNIDYLIIEEFTKELSSLPAAEYFDSHLYNPFKPKAIVAGYDFKIGNRGLGDLEFLRNKCKSLNIELIVPDPFKINNEVVSSSTIRKLLLEGHVEKAMQFLGKPFFLKGIVVEGDKQGRKLGFPTLNLITPEYLIPQKGVYITYTKVKNELFQSVTNIGYKPTFYENNQLVIETHLLNETRELYNKEIVVGFLQRIRDEKKFSSIEILKEQIKKDVNEAKGYFTENELGSINKQ